MKLAIFDFDGTLFKKDTLPFLLTQWKKKKYSRVKYYKAYLSLIGLYIKYKLNINSKLTREEMRLIAVEKFNSIFKGMTEKEINEYLLSCSMEIKDFLNESVVEELNRAIKDGYHTVLLSGSYDNFLKHIGLDLGFDTIIGTRMHFDNEYFDYNKELEIVSGELKLHKIKKYFNKEVVNWKESRAYADSQSDEYILKSVGYPVAVNPDNKLKAIASEMNWKIIS